jgi:hypothetical protein
MSNALKKSPTAKHFFTYSMDLQLAAFSLCWLPAALSLNHPFRQMHSYRIAS